MPSKIHPSLFFAVFALLLRGVVCDGDHDHDDESTSVHLPEWYLQHRVHAHTRLQPNDYCRNDTGAWVCDAVFENAARDLSQIGVPVFVRHTHSYDEGTWWLTETGPKESVHPMVLATGRHLPREFVAKAEAVNATVLFYHTQNTHAY